MQKKRLGLKRYVIIMTLMILVLSAFSGVYASAPYQSYNYNTWGESVPVPPTYMPEKVLDGNQIGVGALNNPGDLFVDNSKNLYILDSGNKRIVETDKNFKLIRVISGLDIVGASGLYVADDGTIYIANTAKGNVLILNPDGSKRVSFGKPKGSEMPDNLVFKPIKIVGEKDNTILIVFMFFEF